MVGTPWPESRWTEPTGLFGPTVTRHRRWKEIGRETRTREWRERDKKLDCNLKEVQTQFLWSMGWVTPNTSASDFLYFSFKMGVLFHNRKRRGSNVTKKIPLGKKRMVYDRTGPDPRTDTCLHRVQYDLTGRRRQTEREVYKLYVDTFRTTIYGNDASCQGVHVWDSTPPKNGSLNKYS